MDQTKITELEHKLRIAMMEQVQYLCETCASYLGLYESAINPTLLWKPLDELPETLTELDTGEDDELQINAFILQSRFDGIAGVSIASEVALKLHNALKNSFEQGNDSWNNRSDFEMGCLQMIHDLAKNFGFEEIRDYAGAFRFSDIGDGA